MSIQALSGRQLELARQLVATASHKITMRYQPGIAPQMRINFNGRHFLIDHIDDGDNRQRFVTFITTEEQEGA